MIYEALQAMRAEGIPAGRAGLWHIVKATPQQLIRNGGGQFCEPGTTYTYLCKTTLATQNKQHGECVMNDVEDELKKHLEFILRASGSVLVTGLGLGCVVRGLLLRKDVCRIDVVEREEDVIRLVYPHLPRDKRLHLHHADALDFARGASQNWDCAWHDLWSNPDLDEPHLAVTHQALMVELRLLVKSQEAWAFPREHRRCLRQLGIS